MGTNDASASTEDAVTAGANDAPLPAPPAPPRKTRRATARTSEFRVAEQPAFVLHSYPYRETSLIVDVLTRDHGRLALVAKGAKRPHSALRGVLQTFSAAAAVVVRQVRGPHADGRRMGRRDAAARGRRVAVRLLCERTARQVLRARDPQPPLFNHYC
ncbi:DNA repair protein RecO [Burkholderia multivorans]|uniref:DNA repair protein RecO n=1 Tax=Burkholderia multivorans TaxID=87883 RepID=UPI0023EBE32A|nr:recombination protein O N-terminal domain-containing protein [Burkholderia multivorans]